MCEKGELVCEVDQGNQAPKGQYVAWNLFTERLTPFIQEETVGKL